MQETSLRHPPPSCIVSSPTDGFNIIAEDAGVLQSIQRSLICWNYDLRRLSEDSWHESPGPFSVSALDVNRLGSLAVIKPSTPSKCSNICYVGSPQVPGFKYVYKLDFLAS